MSWLGGVIEFLGELGLYDIVLPFLLIFTITFAILEKTRILGEEEIGGKKYPRKNLDAMVALVVGLVIVTATQLVAFINQFLAIAALVMVIGIGFLLMVGVFYNPEEGKKQLLEDGWIKAFTVIIFIATILIILHAAGVLDDAYNWVATNIGGEIVGSIIFLAVMIGLVAFIVKSPSIEKKDKEE